MARKKEMFHAFRGFQRLSLANVKNGFIREVKIRQELILDITVGNFISNI
jgi:hypothetical protein